MKPFGPIGPGYYLIFGSCHPVTFIAMNRFMLHDSPPTLFATAFSPFFITYIILLSLAQGEVP
jgi:hypothetical protein